MARAAAVGTAHACAVAHPVLHSSRGPSRGADRRAVERASYDRRPDTPIRARRTSAAGRRSCTWRRFCTWPDGSGRPADLAKLACGPDAQGSGQIQACPAGDAVAQAGCPGPVCGRAGRWPVVAGAERDGSPEAARPRLHAESRDVVQPAGTCHQCRTAAEETPRHRRRNASPGSRAVCSAVSVAGSRGALCGAPLFLQIDRGPRVASAPHPPSTASRESSRRA